MEEDYINNEIVKKVTDELSAQNENLYYTILNLKNKINSLDKKNAELRIKLLDLEELNLDNLNNKALFKENMNSLEIKSLCSELKTKMTDMEKSFSKETKVYKKNIIPDLNDVKKVYGKFLDGSSTNVVGDIKLKNM